ncbi:helix-turn-helix domain-containing protein [Nitrospirillum sp. BR 11752]|uniref:helix-turn-helix domain-containing protein n=1 Tax=Nitrospirillum sp. BR 11752 TaxID=3104293 RepID=UPI002ECD68C5|nr:helix-turn-helix domain-containing protein [Nitrospirillum sp. BR 11752]
MTDDTPFSDQQLAKMRPQATAKRIRRALGLSQEDFSVRYHIPLRTLQEWEQGRREPDAATLAYLRVIEKEPVATARALAAE